MTTTSVYRNPAYLINFGEDGDFFELDLVAVIERRETSSSSTAEFRLVEIQRAVLAQNKMPFAYAMFQRLSPHEQDCYLSLFKQAAVADLTPHLCAYYHEGEIIPNGT